MVNELMLYHSQRSYYIIHDVCPPVPQSNIPSVCPSGCSSVTPWVNSCLSNPIIDIFTPILKFKIIVLKPVLLTLRGRRHWLTKLVLIFIIFIIILVENFYNAIIYMIFQYDFQYIIYSIRLSIGHASNCIDTISICYKTHFSIC